MELSSAGADTERRRAPDAIMLTTSLWSKLAATIAAALIAATSPLTAIASVHHRMHHHRVRIHHRVHRLIWVARRQVGTPYVWGGTSPRTGFDCSGFVQYVFRRVGVGLPRTTWGMIDRGHRVRHLRPGDVLFFWGGSHVALYLGGGLIEDAPHSGARVGVRRLAAYGGYYEARNYLPSG